MDSKSNPDSHSPNLNLLRPYEIQQGDSPLTLALVNFIVWAKEHDPMLLPLREGLFWYAIYYHPTVGHVYEPINKAKTVIIDICTRLGCDPNAVYILILRNQVPLPNELAETVFTDAIKFYITGECAYWQPSQNIINIIKEIIINEYKTYYKNCLDRMK
jgi:hypothetical protein